MQGLLTGQGNPKHKYKLDDESIQNCPMEVDLGILVEENLNMSQQYTLKYATES